MTIRVLLDASTTMVRSALKAALDECRDIELVETAGSSVPADIDVIVVQRRLFRDYPEIPNASRIGIVAINDDGEAGDLYRIRHSAWRFVPGTGGGLADAIRAVASAG